MYVLMHHFLNLCCKFCFILWNVDWGTQKAKCTNHFPSSCKDTALLLQGYFERTFFPSIYHVLILSHQLLLDLLDQHQLDNSHSTPSVYVQNQFLKRPIFYLYFPCLGPMSSVWRRCLSLMRYSMVFSTSLSAGPPRPLQSAHGGGLAPQGAAANGEVVEAKWSGQSPEIDLKPRDRVELRTRSGRAKDEWVPRGWADDKVRSEPQGRVRVSNGVGPRTEPQGRGALSPGTKWDPVWGSHQELRGAWRRGVKKGWALFATVSLSLWRPFCACKEFYWT